MRDKLRTVHGRLRPYALTAFGANVMRRNMPRPRQRERGGQRKQSAQRRRIKTIPVLSIMRMIKWNAPKPRLPPSKDNANKNPRETRKDD